MKQGEEVRAAKPYCALTCGVRGPDHRLCLREGDSLWEGDSLRALVLLVCCGSDAIFRKRSKLTGNNKPPNFPWASRMQPDQSKLRAVGREARG